MDHTVCPGSKFMRQPKPELFPCPGCRGEVEIWSDEISGRCTDCGTVVMRDGTMSCLEWCAMAEECVGDEVFNSYKERKAATVKERLLALAVEAAEQRAVSLHLVERSVYYAEILSREEKADLHVVLAGAVLSQIYPKQQAPARKELLKLGFQLDDTDLVCRMVSDGTGITDDEGINSLVVHDACLLAEQETISETKYAAQSTNHVYLTKSASDLARKTYSTRTVL